MPNKFFNYINRAEKLDEQIAQQDLPEYNAENIPGQAAHTLLFEDINAIDDSPKGEAEYQNDLRRAQMLRNQHGSAATPEVEQQIRDLQKTTYDNEGYFSALAPNTVLGRGLSWLSSPASAVYNTGKMLANQTDKIIAPMYGLESHTPFPDAAKDAVRNINDFIEPANAAVIPLTGGELDVRNLPALVGAAQDMARDIGDQVGTAVTGGENLESITGETQFNPDEIDLLKPQGGDRESLAGRDADYMKKRGEISHLATPEQRAAQLDKIDREYVESDPITDGYTYWKDAAKVPEWAAIPLGVLTDGLLDPIGPGEMFKAAPRIGKYLYKNVDNIAPMTREIAQTLGTSGKYVPKSVQDAIGSAYDKEKLARRLMDFTGTGLKPGMQRIASDLGVDAAMEGVVGLSQLLMPQTPLQGLVDDEEQNR